MSSDSHSSKGKGLSRGPALILGSILLAFGLIAMITHSEFPSFGSGFPDGSARGGEFLGIEVNGWTNWLVAVAGGLLLFGAAQHLLAKIISLVVGLALGACAIIALIDGDILGLGAANIWTIIGLGAAAVVLLVNTLLPRVGGDDGDDDHATRRVRTVREVPQDDRGAVAAGRSDVRGA